MPTLLLALIVLLLCPGRSFAQDAPPAAPPRPNFNLLAAGGFLGQLDGFCEQPGGTYDQLRKPDLKPAPPPLQPCADIGGKAATATWPAAFGGVLGVRTKIDAVKTEGIQPLVVLSGNNQVAQFAFLKTGALNAKAQYFGTPVEVKVTDDQPTQRKNRLLRFWQQIAALKPAAIGLGAEDFVRSLRDPRDALVTGPDRPTPDPIDIPDRGSILHRWLRQVISQGLPIIGTNVVIQMRGDDLNDIKRDEFSLEGIKKNESVDWMKEIRVTHPTRTGIEISFREKGPVGLPDVEGETEIKLTDGKSASTTLNAEKGTLKPGYRYEVSVREGIKVSVLTFQTHSALTPVQNGHIEGDKNTGTRTGYPDLNGFPFIAKTLLDQSPVLILSLVDEAVQKAAGEKAWKWKKREKKCTPDELCDWDEQICPASECEIIFTKPADAVNAAIVSAEGASDGRKPFIVLLSALTDKQNNELLEQYPEIRIVVLDPDSNVLGRASRSYEKDSKGLERKLSRRADEKQEYSGDRGMSGVFGAEHPQTTTLLVRPQWIGETVAAISANVSYSGQQEWEMTPTLVQVSGVPGAALRWTRVDCSSDLTKITGLDCTEFSVEWPAGQTISYGSFPSYLACEGKTLANNARLADQCTMLSSLSDSNVFLAFAGDTLRRAIGAELAILPRTLIDFDAQAWLKPLLDKNHTRVLTRFILERAIFRSFRLVRATVAGDKLLDTVDRAFKSETYFKPCIVGVATGCVDKIDPKKVDTTRVNARAIDPRLFYAIAMPEGLADELKLDYSRNRYTVDAASAIHERLNRREDGWYLEDRDNTLAARAEKRANRKVQFALLTSAFEFGYTKLAPDAALNDANTLKQFDVEFRSVKPATTRTWKLDVDLAVADAQFAAVRVVSQVDFNRRVDINARTGNQHTYPNNNWLYGARADWKHPLFAREMRVYAGSFVEREVEAPREYFSATDKSEETPEFISSRVEKKATLYSRKALEFDYGAVGIEYLNVKNFTLPRFPAWMALDISRASLQVASGRLFNVPKGANINGFERDFGDKGADAILNDYYKAFVAATPGANYDTNLELKATYDSPRHQNRVQAELNTERTYSAHSRDWKFGSEVRYRYFPKTADSDADSLKNYLRIRINTSLPVFPRVQVVPSMEWHRATIMNPKEGAKGTFKYWKIEANVKIPFLVRAGWGWLFK